MPAGVPTLKGLKPKSKKPKTVFVQNDIFVRKNLVMNDTSYEVEQYILGVDEDGQPAVVENPEYDGTLDPNGKLIILEVSKGPKMGTNGQFLPARYEVESTAGPGTPKIKQVRQDN